MVYPYMRYQAAHKNIDTAYVFRKLLQLRGKWLQKSVFILHTCIYT